MARSKLTYRGARRNAAKALRRLRGGTIRLHMLGPDGETIPRSYRPMKILGSKASLYPPKRPNTPGGTRRRLDREAVENFQAAGSR